MASPETGDTFLLGAEDAGGTLAAALRRHLPGKSWADVRRLCTTGKVRLDGETAHDPAVRLAPGQQISLHMAAPRPSTTPEGFRIAFEDGHVVVIDKPSGISSVPYDRKETGTAMDVLRGVWRKAGKRATATPLYIVHRIDKDTSGLLCFAKTRLAERALHLVFQRHTAARNYLAVAEGNVQATRIESRLVADRGDGIRGSAGPRHYFSRNPEGVPNLPRWAAAAKPPPPYAPDAGQLAVTHVEPLRQLRGATLCRVRLETGRTHQIRVHLSERGHPLLGETVYIRDAYRQGRKLIAAPRLMLHAALLGFPHPVTGSPIELHAAPPADFVSVLESLGGRLADCQS